LNTLTITKTAVQKNLSSAETRVLRLGNPKVIQRARCRATSYQKWNISFKKTKTLKRTTI